MNMLASVLERVEGDLALLNELLAMFPECAAECYDELAQALAAGDAQQAAAAAHTLKGMCANLSLDRAAQLALELEQAARAGQLDRCQQMLDQLRAEAQREYELLAELVRQECSREGVDR